jgi:HD-like signal output (HDOD) protein
MATLGVDHARVGGKLAEKWKLPGELVKAIHHHHPAPDQDGFPQAAAIVNLADFISYAKELGKGGPVGSVKFVTEAWEATALRKSDIPAIMDKLRDSAKMAGELLGMVR